MNSKRISIVVCIFQMAVICGIYGLRIDITPSKYTEEHTGGNVYTTGVKISCVPDASDLCEEKHVLVLEIAKDGEKPMAFVRRHLAVSYGKAIPKTYEAHGRIADKGVGETFLNVTIHSPRTEDSGTYSCRMYYFDASGELADESVTENLTVEIFDLHTSVRDMGNTISVLRTQLNEQALQVSYLESKTGTLDKDTGLLKNVTEKLNVEIGVQRDELTALNATTPYNSAFSAALTGTSKIPAGQVIVFTNVIMRRGNGYDNNTGIYTAPRRGTYVFHLAMTCYYGTGSEVVIMANDREIARVRVTTHKDGAEYQSSASTVVDLQEGDQVKAVNEVARRWFGGTRSLFAGYLITCY